LKEINANFNEMFSFPSEASREPHAWIPARDLNDLLDLPADPSWAEDLRQLREGPDDSRLCWFVWKIEQKLKGFFR
jgi:hypothetical protein